jgi:hypothetical protein
VQLLVALLNKSGFAGVGIAARIAALHQLRRACSLPEHGLGLRRALALVAAKKNAPSG